MYPHHTCWPSSFQPTPLGIVSASLIAQRRGKKKEETKRKRRKEGGEGGMSWLKVRKGQENTGRKTGFRTSIVLAKVYFFYGAIRCTRGLFALGDGK